VVVAVVSEARNWQRVAGQATDKLISNVSAFNREPEPKSSQKLTN
jgi:hypothetical protein